MRCACDFCAHLDLTRLVNGRYKADIPDVTFDGQPADIHYEIHFENLNAVRISYDIGFDDEAEVNGSAVSAKKLALKLINRFIGWSEYKIDDMKKEVEEESYHYLAS